MIDLEIQFEIVRDLPFKDVVDLYKEAGWWKEGDDPKAIIPTLLKGSFCVIIAIYHNQIVGMGRVISDGISDALIQDVVVKKKFRGHGIGTELVRQLAHYCIEKNLDWIGLVAEPHTAAFYEKIGFQVLENHQAMILNKDLLK